MHSLLGGGAWGIWHFAHDSELHGNFTKGTDLQALHRADVRTLHDLVSPFVKLHCINEDSKECISSTRSP